MPQSTTQESEDQSFSLTTSDVTVTIRPEFLPERSDIANGIYAHGYKVTIENQSQETIQLLNRHWKVFSSGKQIADVKGEGVVGEQPVLEPEEQFEYESWTVVRDAAGSMVGTYTFVSDAGIFFDVEVPEFPLLHIEDMTVH